MDALEAHELAKLELARDFDVWSTAYAFEPTSWGRNWLSGVVIKHVVAAWNAGIAAERKRMMMAPAKVVTPPADSDY